jgi:hypothetical protein
MTQSLAKRKTLISLVVAILCLASWVAWLCVRTPADEQAGDRLPAHPKLFGDSSRCPEESDPLAVAARLEERARLRADRYAYDPSDGVLAVVRYQEAEDCYRAAGRRDGVLRTREIVAVMSVRIDADYAAARLNLVNALERERWQEALGIIERLLLLTHHLGRNEYVEWLHEIEGRVAARAATTS